MKHTQNVGLWYPKKSIMSTSNAFELLYMDLFGPTTYTSIGGNKYGGSKDVSVYDWKPILCDCIKAGCDV